MRKTLILSALVALIITAGVLGIFYAFVGVPEKSITIEHVNSTPARGVTLTVDKEGELIPLDFTKTAEEVVDAVVHIKSTQTLNRRPREQTRPFEPPQLPDPFRDFFDDFFDSPFRFETPRGEEGPQVRMGTGSGVIISEDGHIVTNYHVIKNADDIEVTLYDNRTFKATVVGADPSTDLALLQIKADDLSTLPFADSDEVKVGGWVLAVGNPMGLNSTVTAGIVSAKARSINILREEFAIESFIQTDAAINPGNSGGALVDLQGGLVGINTAIASPTGVYAGYGFAVPSNIVSKVVEDLLKYGVVQRGVLGVMIRSVDGNLASEKSLEVTSGAYVDSLLENSAAAKAGIRVGDVITGVEGEKIRSSSELQEEIAGYRPGDKVTVTVNRNGEFKTFEVTLSNREGAIELAKKEHEETLRILGAEFEEVDEKTARELDIDGGVKVSRLYAGKLRQQTNMQEGFIITKVDGQIVRTVDELARALENKEGGVMLEGVYEDLPGKFYYAFGIS